MRFARIAPLLLALAAACQKDSVEGPIAACKPVDATCSSDSECCSYGCVEHYIYTGQTVRTCEQNPMPGGWCKTSDDCSGGMSCKGAHCTADPLVCRDDGDVCSPYNDAQCCSNNCTSDGVCVRGNSPPVARITGTPGTTGAPRNSTIYFSASSSYDPDQTSIQSWEWTVTSRPAGSVAALTGASSSSATLVPDKDGPWTVQLKVFDGIDWSAAVTASFTVTNAKPIARITASATTVPRGTVVTLSSATSSDANSDPMTFTWTVTVGSAATPVTLDPIDDTKPAQRTFTASAADVYNVRLVASDGIEDSLPATLQVTSQNLPPVANPGPSRVINLGKTSGPAVQLDGSGSTDPNPGDAASLTYEWTFSPPDGAVQLDGSWTCVSSVCKSAAQKPVFTPLVTNTYAATLRVQDATGLWSTSTPSVTIKVLPHIWKLAYAVADAKYSKALDRVVAVSATPTGGELHVIDSETETVQSLALAKPPKAVGVSPDGTKAVVGYDALVTYVDLTGGIPVRIGSDVIVGVNIGEVVLGPEITKTKTQRFAYLLPAVGSTGYTLDVLNPLASSGDPNANPRSFSVSYYTAGGSAALDATRLYAPEGSDYVDLFDVTTGWASYLQYKSLTGMGRDLWMSEHSVAADVRLYGGNAGVAQVSTLTYAGILGNGTGFGIQHANHRLTAALDRVSVIPKSDGYTYNGVEDIVVKSFDGKTYVLQATDTLPPWGASGSTEIQTHGLFVFQRSDASARYVILDPDGTPADPVAPGGTAQHGIVVFSP
jgi:chitinase